MKIVYKRYANGVEWMRGETMPNIITHYLFAESVKQEINDSATLSAIKEYPNEYIMGRISFSFTIFSARSMKMCAFAVTAMYCIVRMSMIFIK